MFLGKKHRMMICGVTTMIVIGGVAAVSMFAVMPPRKQRAIKRGLRKAIDDLNELADDITDTVKNINCDM